MMDKKELHSSLSLFIEKADKLSASNFVKNATKDSGVTLKLHANEPSSIERRGPDEENIDAFVLTFRFFIQDNEKISFRQFENVFSSQFALPQETENFSDARKLLNEYLDGDTMFQISGKISRRKLMETIIYGGLSHANPAKKPEFDTWMRDPILSQFMANEFVVILVHVLKLILYVRKLSEEMLERTLKPETVP